MWETIFLVGTIGLSWWCKNQIQTEVQAVVMLMGGSARTGTGFYALIFFPGIVIHEITHFFTAAVLGVPTGDISLFPQFQSGDEKKVALGSVKIGRSDFIRESLIGVAPFLSGGLAIYCLVTIAMQQPVTWKMVGVIYLILAIANTMFPSKEDARAWPVMWMVGIMAVGILAAKGWLIWVSGQAEWVLVKITQSISISLIVVLLIDVVLWLFLGVWQILLEKITRKKVVKVVG